MSGCIRFGCADTYNPFCTRLLHPGQLTAPIKNALLLM